MTGKMGAVLAVLAAICLAQAGCSSEEEDVMAPAASPATPPTEASLQAPPADASWVSISKEARAEMRKRSRDREITWLVAYNGTCSNAPSLGIYDHAENAPADAVEMTGEGFRFLVEQKVVDCFDEWGKLIIEAYPDASGNWLSARFADKNPAE